MCCKMSTPSNVIIQSSGFYGRIPDAFNLPPSVVKCPTFLHLLQVQRIISQSFTVEFITPLSILVTAEDSDDPGFQVLGFCISVSVISDLPPKFQRFQRQQKRKKTFTKMRLLFIFFFFFDSSKVDFYC